MPKAEEETAKADPREREIEAVERPRAMLHSVLGKGNGPLYRREMA